MRCMVPPICDLGGFCRPTIRAEIGLDYAPDDDWPFAFAARQAFALSPNGLTLRLSIRNAAIEPAPAGIGWHPYFLCAPDSVWRHDARTLWRLGPDFVPTGEASPYAGETDDNLYLSAGAGRR